ncbi:MAG: S8 family serine peptidase [Planctomycetes bacterium]|nr:S8 family serine peptidase [Planctomycetota bacterium]
MLRNLALVCLALIVGIGVFAIATQPRLHSQDAEASAATGQSPVSSLELGEPYDLTTQWRFEQELAEHDRERLICLRSRFALADAACPLPATSPLTPFYLKLRSDLTRAQADRLTAAGATFIGYANPHTHILRARDAGSLHAIGAMVRDEPAVLGTLLQREEDKLAPGLVGRARPGNLAGEYRVLFWRDVPLADAALLLEASGASVLEGGLSGASPLLTVSLPHTGVLKLIESVWVENICPAGFKLITNQTSAAMSNATSAIIDVAPYNLDGNGQVAAVWDAGTARESHEQYTGLAGVTAPAGWPGASRVENMDSTATHYHAAHVTGTIVGNGTNNATAQGYAPRAVCLVHDWNDIDAERREAIHTWHHVADNHSYSDFTGGSDDWAQYNSGTQQADITNRDLLICQVQSAGNYATSKPGGTGAKPFGTSNPTGSVSTYNAHRNGFIIAAAQDNEDLASFSSCGPAMDGRLVPQFCANGVSLTSSIDSGDAAYSSLSGTSMSGPSVCGSLVLLSELWRREHNDQMLAPDVARAVLAQTCRDKYNTGPDYHYGFGIVDCKAGADLVLADKAGGGDRIFRGTIRSGEVNEYSFNVTTGDPLHIVLSWLDIWASSAAAITLVNDLDIELRDPVGAIYYPWSGVTTPVSDSHTHVFTNTGPNRRDNIELAHVDNPMAGVWTLRVKGYSIPANPQTGVPNDATGFVVASSHSVSLQKLLIEDAVNGATPVSIPDNSAAGLTRTFTVNDPRIALAVRLHARVYHERRGDLAVTLTSPSNTVIQLKTTNNGMLDDATDLIAVFPDTKQDDADVAAALYEYVQGNWTVRITDTVGSNTGSLAWLALEFDLRSNAAPVADAGANFNVRENNGGQLNGSASFDSDGDPLTYAWLQTGGAITLNLSSSSVAQPTFTAPSVSQDEVVTFQLTVSDLSGDISTDMVQVTVKNNLPPGADAGNDFSLRENENGQLDAFATSDPESDPISYAWVQISGAITLSLSNPAAVQPTFTAPTVTQDELVVFELTATDNRGDFTTDTVQVTVLNNLAPTANAGADFGLLTGNGGQLDATASTDPESDPLTYLWLQVAGAVTVSLSSASDAQPTFTAPAVTQNELLTFQLTVSDDRGDFSSDIVQVTIELNLPPVADAGANFALAWSAAGQLDGTGSTDPNSGDVLTYNWVQIGGANVVTLSSASDAQPTFTAPGVDDTLQFELTVSDSKGLVSTDIVIVWVNQSGTPPVSGGGGGKEDGGCSTGGGNTWLYALLLAVIAAALARRRRTE